MRNFNENRRSLMMAAASAGLNLAVFLWFQVRKVFR